MYKSNLLPKLYLSQSESSFNNSQSSFKTCPQLYPASPIVTKSVQLPPVNDNHIISPPPAENYQVDLIPQYKRMQMLEEKIRLLENRNISNNEQLKNLIENDYLSHRRFPKYTIIQNTPISSREEITNEILKMKLGPNACFSYKYPKIIYKNQEEINKYVTNAILNGDKKKENEELKGKNFLRVEDQLQVIQEEKDNEPQVPKITNELLYKLQKENFELKNRLQETENKMKNMQVEVDIKMKEILSKQSLTIESLRNIILKGGSNKLKASMHNILDNKTFNVEEVENEEDILKKKVADLIKEKVEEAEKNIQERENKRIQELEQKLKEVQEKKEKIKDGEYEEKKDIDNNSSKKVNLLDLSSFSLSKQRNNNSSSSKIDDSTKKNNDNNSVTSKEKQKKVQKSKFSPSVEKVKDNDEEGKSKENEEASQIKKKKKKRKKKNVEKEEK